MKEFRLAKKGLLENVVLFQRRRFLLKWKQRKEATFKMRKLCMRGKQ